MIDDEHDNDNPPTEAATTTFNVVTYNTFTAVMEPVRFLGQRERLRQMAPELARIDADVIVLCECIVPTVIEDLLTPLAALGWCYCTEPLMSSRLLPSIVNGGVFIVSRWPIVHQDQRVFSASCGVDALAAKGVVYAHVRKDGESFHVLGTHMQAWDTPEGCKVRLEQSREIRRLIDHLDIPREDPVLLAGDLNIDMEARWPEMQQFLRETRMTLPPAIGPEPHTVSRKNQLVGNDDPTQYTSEHWPDGCYDLYQQTLECVCCPNTWIDYVLTSDRHLAPVRFGASIQSMPLRVRPYQVQLNLTTFRTVRDLSDHYAVLGRFVFSHRRRSCAVVDARTPRVAGNTTGDDDNHHRRKPPWHHRVSESAHTHARAWQTVAGVAGLIVVVLLLLVLVRWLNGRTTSSPTANLSALVQGRLKRRGRPRCRTL